MTPGRATHIAVLDGITTYYEILDGSIMVWDAFCEDWFSSAYTSVQEFEDDGVELIQL